MVEKLKMEGSSSRDERKQTISNHCKLIFWPTILNFLNAKLNPICHLLALLGAHHILHVSRIRVKYGSQISHIRRVILYLETVKCKVKSSRYRPSVTQRVGRGTALLFHDRGTRRGWVVSSTPRPHFTAGKDPVPILQDAGWATGQVWMGGKILSPPGFDPGPSSPLAQSLYRLSYRAHA